MKDEGIVRNRAKIEATIDNAKAYVRLSERTSLREFLCGFLDAGPVQNRNRTMADIPAKPSCRSASRRP
jgi:DNA-3-methyladenine glycosylase I